MGTALCMELVYLRGGMARTPRIRMGTGGSDPAKSAIYWGEALIAVSSTCAPRGVVEMDNCEPSIPSKNTV
ncbi:MAG: hypothetical protein ACJATT_003343 [Myxococcota bacterium]|jgi:hypothetical protein